MRLVQHKAGRSFLATQVLALLGDNLTWLAMGIWVKSLTGSNAAAGLTFFAFTPQLLSPFAGVIVDRFRRRSILIGCSLANAAAMVPLLWVSNAGDIYLIYAVMVCYGTTNTLLAPAQSAYLATVLPDELLPAGNAFLQSASQGLKIFAPLLGATLFGLYGGSAIVIVNIAVFLGGALVVSRLRTVEPPVERSSESLAGELGAGIRHLRSVPSLRQVTIALAIVMTVVGFSETLIYAIVDTGLHRVSSFVGVVAAVQGSGAIAGALAAPWLTRQVGERVTAGLGMVLLAAACPLLAVPALGVVFAGTAMFGARFGRTPLLAAQHQGGCPPPLREAGTRNRDRQRVRCRWLR